MRGGRLMLIVAVIASLAGVGLAIALKLQSNALKRAHHTQPR
jgi:hypothetical protein